MKITNTYEYQKLRGLKRKVELIELKGGCCEKCGYDKNIAAFDFHHKDPSQKSYQLDMRKLSNTSMINLMEEVEKCSLLCANCHREFHSPDLEMSNVKLLIKDVDDSVLEMKKIGKPKCLDCGDEINYTSKRCQTCNYKTRRIVNRPDFIVLQKEVADHSQEWCGKKYGVSRMTIRRWLKMTQNLES
jgi:hypothetical protein